MSNKILAIDIHEDQISGLLVKTGLKGMRDDGFSSVLLSDAPEFTSRFEWGIQKVIEGLDTSGAVCLLSIPSGYVSYRNLKVPFLDRKKIRQVLPFELEPLLPFEIEELFIDFMPVSCDGDTGLIAAAVKNETLDMFTSVFEGSHLTPRIVTAGGIAQAMCIADKSTKQMDRFLYIDADITGATIFVVASGRIHLVHQVRTPKNMDVHARAARVSSNLSRVSALFEARFESDFIAESVIVSKTSGLDDEFIPLLAQSTGLPVKALDVTSGLMLNISLENPKEPGEYDTGQINAPFCLAAVELLSISPINFSREHYAISKYWGENKNQIITTAMLGVFVFILMMFTVVLDAHFLQQRVDVLNEKIASVFHSTLPGVPMTKAAVQQMKVELKQMKEKAVYSGETGNNVRNIDILSDMSRLVPDDLDVVFTRFIRGDNAVLIAGVTDTFNAVDDIKGRLETSAFLSHITISSANMDKTINRVRFNIKADIAGIQSGS
ncbi:MAG: hypothetical protein GXP53_08490 [Deltaproteobacteria bacterium]|nr:hypothetical protein [Deltaproteobacteria bacterium]